jgi:hypothetical protein
MITGSRGHPRAPNRIPKQDQFDSPGMVMIDVIANGLFQFRDAFEDAISNAVLRQASEPD